MATFKIVVNFNGYGLSKCTNVFYFQPVGIVTDEGALDAARTWMQSIYDPLLGQMDSGLTFLDGQVYEVADDGTTIRIVGQIEPNISGTVGTDGTALPTAGSATARTTVSRVRGGKRFAGMIENRQKDGLFDNELLAALAQVLLQWLAGYIDIIGPDYTAGVISSKEGGFVPFSESGLVTNVPGTQVTRKPGRGA